MMDLDPSISAVLGEEDGRAPPPIHHATPGYQSFFENAVEGIYRTTVDGRYLDANQSLANIYGYESPAALKAAIADIAAQLYVNPKCRVAFREAVERDGFVRGFEARARRADGRLIWITENARCVRDARGGILYFEGTVEDITAKKEADEQIRMSAAVFENVADGIVILDNDKVVRAVNPAYEAMTDCPAADIVGRRLDLLADGFHEKTFLQHVWAEIEERGRWSGDATCWRRTGDPFVAAVSMIAVPGIDPGSRLTVITCSDISSRKRQEARIWHHANYDLLTELPNRHLTTEHLQQAMLQADRGRASVAVLYLDIDDFKQVNDALGHTAGDELLRLVTRRLRSCTRHSDVIGRIGGDEFLLVAAGVSGPSGVGELCEKIHNGFQEPFMIGAREIHCRPSIGVALYPADGADAETVIRNADVAMYEAKRNKSLRFVMFRKEMQASRAFSLDIRNDLARAIERGELDLYFQPKFNNRLGRIVGAEALLRWRHPTRGMVMPNDFISLAESSGLIVSIGAWTLREGCRQLAHWRANGVPLDSLSINLSPRQFLDPGLLASVEDALTRSGLPPSALELELTEGAMAVDVDHSIEILNGLKRIGVRLSIDDFGTGYSSLMRLKTLPIDVLKIDQSFVRDLGKTAADDEIVKAIIDLARVLGFSVVAEGVETAEQVAVLGARDCHTLQGYLFGRPIHSSAFAAVFQSLGSLN